MYKIMRAWDKGNSKVAFVYRDKETGRKKIGETKFEWWFYIKTSDYEHYKNQFKSFENQNLIIRCEPEGLYTRVYVERPHRTELFNTEMEFVWEHKNFQFNELQQKLELLGIQTYEADVLPYKRFCLQENVEFEDQYKLLFLDIETDDRVKNGQPVPGEYRILSVALGEMNGKIAWLCIDEDTDESEKAMLIKLAKIMNSYDVLIGWNSSLFDLPYIKSRFMRYGISIDWRKLFSQDFMKIFQKTVSLRSYALDVVAKELELEGKVDHTEYSIYRMWKENRPLLKEYNIQDVNIMIELEKKTNYLNAARNVNIIGMCPCDDPYITRKIDNLMLKQAQEDKHFHFKTMVKKYGEEDVDDVSYKGAYVFPTKPGIYYGIKVFDFSSLYPNTIKTLNISPDTLINHGDNIDEKFIITTPTPAKHKFRKDFIGILPKVIMKMKKNRDYYKDLMAKEEPGSVMHKTYDTLQYVYKSFGLSFYDALGEKHTRFYDVRIAESVTLGGQYFNKTCAAWLEKQGKVIVYGDSVTKNRHTIIKIGDEISVLSFEELYNMCDKFTHQRGKEFGEFENSEVFTLSYNFNTKQSEWKRINVVIRHKTNKKVYRYRYRYGITECTEDHSLIDANGNNFKPTEHFNAFSIPIINNEINFSRIDLTKYIDDYSYKTKHGNQIDLTWDSHHIYFNQNRKTLVKFNRYIEEKDFELFVKTIAHYICNGSSSTQETTKSRNMLSFCTKDKTLLTEIKGFIDSNTINSNGTLIEEKWGYKLNYGNKLLSVIFKQLCGQKFSGKKIPSFIYNMNNYYKKLFVESLIDGDGSINYTKTDKSFDFETESINVSSGLSVLLKMLNYNVVCQTNRGRQTTTIKTLIPGNENYGKHLIKNVLEELDYCDYVYDISVEDNNNFVDAVGNLLLHNTDSVFVEKITPEQIDKIIKYLAKLCELHAKQKFNCDECTLEMAYDKGFHKFIICNAKKKYAGYLNYLDGHIVDPMKLKITGFEYVRNDVCYFVKKHQKEFLTWLLNDKSPDLLEVRDWIINKRSYVMSGKLTAEELAFSKKITKPLSEYATELPQVKVAKQMIEDGKDFWVGDKVQYFFLTFDSKKKPVPLPIYRYKGTYNSSYYWNNCIFPAFERILVVAFPSVKWDEYYILDKNKTGSLKVGRSLWT